MLFLGTLEPRKNVGALLDAYELLAGRTGVPPLLLAGKATSAASEWLDRLARPPLRGLVRHLGYVDPSARRDLYEGALMLVQPSLEEGFGLPVLEAMTAGVPVVAADRGALPEVLGGAGLLVEPDDPGQIASAIERFVEDKPAARDASARGIERAKHFSWARAARDMLAAYQLAIEARVRKRGAA